MELYDISANKLQEMFDVDKIIMYLRKSRSDNENESVDEVLRKHEAILQDYAQKSFGKAIPQKNIFKEIVSGETIEARPEMQKVLSLLVNGDYDSILVVEPQRITRGDMFDCGKIIRIFKNNNITIITPSKIFNLTEKYDLRFFEMELNQGNEYLEYTKMIMNRGRIQSVMEGNYIGNQSPFGYDKSNPDKKTHTLVPNKDADVVRLMFDLFVNHNLGTTSIATELDRRGIKPMYSTYWNSAAIREMLKNPLYIGKIRWNHKVTKKFTDEHGNTYSKRSRKSDDVLIVDGKHPAIIDEETFYKAQEKFGATARVPGNRTIRNPFATIVKCGTCGRSMSLRTYKDSDGNPRSSPRLLCTQQTHCHTTSVEYNRFEKAVVDVLKLFLKDFEIKLESSNNNEISINENVLAELKKELDGLSAQQERLYDFLERGLYTDEVFIERNNKLAIRRAELLEAIEFQKNNIPTLIDYQDKIFNLSKAIDMLTDESINAQDKNAFLCSFIKQINYYCTEKGNRWNEVPFSLEIIFK